MIGRRAQHLLALIPVEVHRVALLDALAAEGALDGVEVVAERGAKGEQREVVRVRPKGVLL